MSLIRTRVLKVAAMQCWLPQPAVCLVSQGLHNRPGTVFSGTGSHTRLLMPTHA